MALDLNNLKFDSEDPDAESLADKIKAVKELLDSPPDGFWGYDMLESIVIYWEENKVLSAKQQDQINAAWERWCC